MQNQLRLVVSNKMTEESQQSSHREKTTRHLHAIVVLGAIAAFSPILGGLSSNMESDHPGSLRAGLVARGFQGSSFATSFHY